MSDLDDKEDYQVHRNAWVKEHGTKRGFNTHNYKRYGFANESALRRHIGRRESIRSDKRGTGDNGSKKHRRVQNNSSGNSQLLEPLEYHSRLADQEIRNIVYGQLEPTQYISPLPHLDWLRYYVSKDMYYLDLKPLNELQDLLWNGNKELALLPRFGGKTVTYLGMVPREIAEIRQPHLTICSPKRPKTLYRAVEKVILHSTNFRRDYGDILQIKDGRVQANRSDLTMLIHDEFDYPYIDPIYRSVSRETDVIGNHPVHLHFEDPSQHETTAGTAKLIQWYGDVVEPMLSMDDKIISRQTGTTTRKSKKDFANFLFEDGWDEFRYAALTLTSGRWPEYRDIVWKDHVTRSGQTKRKIDYIKETGTYDMFNPRWNLQRLLEIRIKKLSSFMSQYQNQPISIMSDFLEPFEIIEPLERRYYEGKEVMVIDPAFGKSASSSETAILLGFLHGGKDIYITEIIIDRLYASKITNKIFELYEKHRPKATMIEDDFKQITTRYGMYNNLRRLPGFKTFENRGFGDKHARVQMLEEPLAMHGIKVFNTCQDLNKLEDQVNGYSEDVDINHGYDGLDCLASFYRLTKKHNTIMFKSW